MNNGRQYDSGVINMKVNGVEVDVHDYDSSKIGFEPKTESRVSSYAKRMREYAQTSANTQEKTITINGAAKKKLSGPAKLIIGIIIATQLFPIIISIVIGIIAFIIEICV